MIHFGGIHARHNGMAMIAWMDGHVKAHRLNYRPWDSYSWAPSGDQLKEAKVGILAKYPLQSFSEYDEGQPAGNGYNKQETDFYYYLASPKPGHP